MWVKMEGGTVVKDCRLVFGNMGTTVVTANATMKAIIQRYRVNKKLLMNLWAKF